MVISDAMLSSFLGVLFLLLAVILSGLHEKSRRNKDWVTEKITLKNLFEGHHFYDCTSSFLCQFLLLSSSTPSSFPSEVLAEWPLQRYTILLWVVFCVMIWVNSQKYENLFQFNTSWLASLRTWYILDFSFSVSCSDYDLTLMKKSHIKFLFLIFAKVLIKNKNLQTCL